VHQLPRPDVDARAVTEELNAKLALLDGHVLSLARLDDLEAQIEDVGNEVSDLWALNFEKGSPVP
jgi:hypothetical protein